MTENEIKKVFISFFHSHPTHTHTHTLWNVENWGSLDKSESSSSSSSLPPSLSDSKEPNKINDKIEADNINNKPQNTEKETEPEHYRPKKRKRKNGTNIRAKIFFPPSVFCLSTQSISTKSN